MSKPQLPNNFGSKIFLTGNILLANLNFPGLIDYALKALIGGAIWMGFKLAGDLLSDWLRKKKEQ